MKVKQKPDDFVVEELTDVAPGGSGEFAFYRLEKTGWNTADALEGVRRRWQLDFRRVSYGGLKDRHAVTSQHFTVYRGPERGVEFEKVKVAYLGRIPHPFLSEHIRANRFRIAVRSLNSRERSAVEAAAAEVVSGGMPNYFDDQRFGSVVGGEFPARLMVLGRFEDALKLALAGHYEFDRAAEKAEKQLLHDRWGDWPGLKAALPRGHARSLVDFLTQRPGDFKGAVARLRPELQGLYLAAYQSHVWNRTLARWLLASAPPESFANLALKLGPHPVPRTAVPGFRGDEHLPLPSARLKPLPDAPWLPHLTAVLHEDGLTPSTMKVPGLDKPYFSKGDRPVWLRPAALQYAFDADDLNRGSVKLTLNFELPRGSYATMVVKRITTEDV